MKNVADITKDDPDYKIHKIGKFVGGMNSVHLATRDFRINSRISVIKRNDSVGCICGYRCRRGGYLEKVKYTRRRCVGFFSVYVGNPILRTGPAINHRRCNLPVINRRGKSR